MRNYKGQKVKKAGPSMPVEVMGLTEVPVAGYINGRFVSRRIDRLVINDDKKEVSILDYKTDVDKSTFHDKYVAQIKEYVTLLYGIYPEYKIHAYLLWLNDFSLEEVL